MRRTLLYLLSFCLLALLVIGQTVPVLAEAEQPQGFSLEAELDYEKWAGKTIKDLLVLYGDLSKQASDLLKDEITIPVPPSLSVSCPDEGEEATQGKNRTDFIDAFNSPELPLLQEMYDVQRQLQVLGEPAQQEPAMEFRLMNRLEKKALKLIKEYGKDAQKVSAIASVSLNVARILELTGADKTGSSALMPQVASMYEAALNKLLKMLGEEHDYGAVNTIIEFGRAFLRLGGVEQPGKDILTRLQNAMRFELTLKYFFEQENHRWVQEATFEVVMALDGNSFGSISGNGTGKLLSFVWDDGAEVSVTAPDFPVQANFQNFDPCGATAELLLTPFHPLSETLYMADQSMDWPLLKISWETFFKDSLQEDGLYRLSLVLHNLDATAVNETITYSKPYNEVRMEVVLVHQPRL